MDHWSVQLAWVLCVSDVILWRISADEIGHITGLGGFNGPGPIGEVTPEKEAHALFTYAADRGVTFWDTSIIYGESVFLYFVSLTRV